jgi:hypothetical protein
LSAGRKVWALQGAAEAAVFASVVPVAVSFASVAPLPAVVLVRDETLGALVAEGTGPAGEAWFPPPRNAKVTATQAAARRMTAAVATT